MSKGKLNIGENKPFSLTLPRNQGKSETDQMRSFALTAINYNMLRIAQQYSYGSPNDFLDAHFEACLASNIVPAQVATHKTWKDMKVVISDAPNMELKRPVGLRSIPACDTACDTACDSNDPEKPKEYWPFKFNRLILPPGWSLKAGCPCDRRLNRSSFQVINAENTCQFSGAFFSDDELRQSNHSFFDDLLQAAAI